jgi:hypothetical protein
MDVAEHKEDEHEEMVEHRSACRNVLGELAAYEPSRASGFDGFRV